MSSWWKNLDLWIALLALLGIAVHLVLRWTVGSGETIPLAIVIAVGGVPLVFGLLRDVLRGKFGADLLAGISIVTAAILGEWLAGAIVVLMLSGGEALEAYAVRRAGSLLETLAARMPSVAHLRRGSSVEDVDVAALQIGDEVVVMPHETCPVDGFVIDGHGSMDESYLTGEPFRVSKAPGVAVLSGAVNGDTALTIRATQLAEDSRYAQIMEVMEEARQSRPQMRKLADRLGALYTPLAVAIGIAAWLIAGDPVRFLAVMVIATPCPLLIGIPVALLGAITLAARKSIVIRDPRILEQIDRCEVLILDKTGTLTLGEPSLTNIHLGDSSEREVLRLAAAVERYSKHPLADAILRRAADENIELVEADEVREPPGAGLMATVDRHTVRITSRNALLDEEHPAARHLPPIEAGLECVVLVDDQYGGTFHFHDEPRTEGRSFIDHLEPQHRFDHVVIVSGDRESEVRYLADRVGIDAIFAEQTPEQKVEIVRRLTAERPTLYVGDGINDAPALMTATVGVAFGQANEITGHAAGAVIMNPTLIKLDELIHIGTRLRKIALQTAGLGMGLSIVGMGFAAFGFLTPVAGALLQEGIDLLSVLNALRMPFGADKLSDVEQ